MRAATAGGLQQRTEVVTGIKSVSHQSAAAYAVLLASCLISAGGCVIR